MGSQTEGGGVHGGAGGAGHDGLPRVVVGAVAQHLQNGRT